MLTGCKFQPYCTSSSFPLQELVRPSIPRQRRPNCGTSGRNNSNKANKGGRHEKTNYINIGVSFNRVLRFGKQSHHQYRGKGGYAATPNSDRTTPASTLARS